nr:MAG TPA: hypothetical protein [Caudoviricetes sp.]
MKASGSLFREYVIKTISVKLPIWFLYFKP